MENAYKSRRRRRKVSSFFPSCYLFAQRCCCALTRCNWFCDSPCIPTFFGILPASDDIFFFVTGLHGKKIRLNARGKAQQLHTKWRADAAAVTAIVFDSSQRFFFGILCRRICIYTFTRAVDRYAMIVCQSFVFFSVNWKSNREK